MWNVLCHSLPATRHPRKRPAAAILLAFRNFSLLHVGRSSTVKIHVMWSSNTCMAFGITFGSQGRFCSGFTWLQDDIMHGLQVNCLKKRRLNQSWSVGLQLNLSFINKSRLTLCLIDVKSFHAVAAENLVNFSIAKESKLDLKEQVSITLGENNSLDNYKGRYAPRG